MLLDSFASRTFLVNSIAREGSREGIGPVTTLQLNHVPKAFRTFSLIMVKEASRLGKLLWPWHWGFRTKLYAADGIVDSMAL